MSQFIDRQWPNLPLRGGALPYRHDLGRQLEILLIRRADQAVWSLPKGHPSAGLPLHRTAVIEAFEEAGVEGDVDEIPLGSFLYRKANATLFGQKVVEVVTYPLLVTRELESWPEADIRLRQWTSIDRAEAGVAPGQLPVLFRKLEHMVAATAFG